MTAFRALTLNIWNLNQWAARRDAVVACIDQLAPDVVCLQEAIEDDDGRNQARWIAEHCVEDWDVAYDGAAVPWRPGGRFGNAVLSRVPITETATRRLTYVERADDVQRLVLHARCGDVDVFSTHLNWRFEDGVVREAQVQELATFVDERAAPDSPLPPVVGGDFNAEADSAEIRFLSGLSSVAGRSVYYQDAWRVAGGGTGHAADPGWTWDNRNPFAAIAHEPNRRIDYVFVGWRRDGGAGRVESCRVVANRPKDGVYPSDHFGVLAEIAR